MIKELLTKLGSMMSGGVAVDPAKFNDPLALTIAWTPNRRGGANFCTHRLSEIAPERLEFKATATAAVFCAIFAIVGLGIMIAFPAIEWSHGFTSFKPEIIGPMLVGALFAVVGGVMLYAGRAPIVFDKRIGVYWKGRKSPEETFNRSDIKECCELGQIYALQIISERCSSKNGSYYSYELNLVLGDGKRITVVDHGSYSKLREDADKLSAFLGRPIWDGIAQ